MSLPEGYEHLKPWKRFIARPEPVQFSALMAEGMKVREVYMLMVLQSLYEAGCLRRPDGAVANLRRKLINESRGQDG